MFAPSLSAMRLPLAAALVMVVSGCAGTGSAPYEPDEHSFKGMPSGSHDDVEKMFDLPDVWPEGAPTRAVHRGQDMGLWQPVGNTEEGCIEYQLLPDDPRHVAPETTHYWHGDMYRTDPDGCVPVSDVVHSEEEVEASQDHDAEDTPSSLARDR